MVITAKLVKELRDKTGAGMMDCKKALEETGGDIEKAIHYLRERGIAKAQKKAARVAAEGLTNILVKGNEAILYELNSETDFVAKNDQFLELVDLVGHMLIDSTVSNVEDALKLTHQGETLAQILLTATATIGEKITLRRVIRVQKEAHHGFGVYRHMGGRISVLTVLTSENSEVAKDLSMHVTVHNPRFLKREDVDQKTIDEETQIIKEQIAQDESLKEKPEKVIEGIVKGRLNKTLQEFVLVDQAFVKDPSIKVAEYLKKNQTDIINAVRLEVGEGIEKVESDFAEEVMAQVKK